MTRKMGQIGGANVVWDAEDDGNAGSTAQPVCGLWGTPPSAIVYPFHSSSGECRLINVQRYGDAKCVLVVRVFSQRRLAFA